eukprot:TRINITY_DN3989_c0_g1_i1.p2 TRINITY_DN3989_c0_g1~~TRINITY_DN3989_c0_g1_i1.p2  ORF type:complete len:390 (+),score=197.82 TRINITY_DN3989_c0_g1_i1:55-1224(+)
MGKKKGAKPAPKKGGGDESKAEFEAMLAELSTATKNNSGLVNKSGPQSKRDSKAKLQQIKKDNEQKVQDELQQRQQMARFMEMLKRQVAASQAEFLETPSTAKTVEEKTSDDLMVSSVGMQGWRRSMEDAHLAQLPEDEVAVYGVFDGHSGADVSAYAAEHLMEVLKAQDAWKERDFEKALSAGFMQLDADMREKNMTSGSTATVVLVDHQKNKIFCANAGDSRAIMSVAGKTVDLSEDHKPNVETEKARIEKAGSTVDDASGIPRVNSMLAVSRGFGDFSFKKAEGVSAEEQAITAFPEIKSFDLTDEVQYIVVACDGIWDCLTSQEVIQKMQGPVAGAGRVDHVTEATKNLFDSIIPARAQALGTDNMSMVTIRFNKAFTAAEKTAA